MCSPFPSIGIQNNNISRFEEVEEEEPSKGQKRGRDSDVADTLKSNKKNKKLKAVDGKPVVPEADAVKGEEKADAKKPDAEVGKDGKKEKKKDKNKKKADATPGEKPTSTTKTIGDGLVIEDAVVGTGPMAKKGNTVRMRYVGKLTNGKEFDKNTSGKPVCNWALTSIIESYPPFSSLSISERVKSLKVQSSHISILFLTKLVQVGMKASLVCKQAAKEG